MARHKRHDPVRMVTPLNKLWWVCPTCGRKPGWRRSRATPRCIGIRIYWHTSYIPEIPREFLLPDELARIAAKV